MQCMPWETLIGDVPVYMVWSFGDYRITFASGLSLISNQHNKAI